MNAVATTTDQAPPLRKADVQAVFPVSPMQEALLHAAGHDTEDIGFVQAQCRLEGRLNEALFRHAWELVFDRHEALRMSIQQSKKLAKTLLVVHKTAIPSTEITDLRDRSTTEQARQIENYCARDRRQGLRLDRAPVGRIALFKLGDATHQLIWSCHHALLDGWSSWIVVDEWLKTYAALSRGASVDLPVVPPLKRFFEASREVDADDEAAFWSDKLEGFTTPTHLSALPSYRATEPRYQRVETTVEPTTLDALRTLARACRVTTGAIVSAAWALLLRQHTGSNDTLFGTVVSGRPADLAGADRMVGMFVNTVPFRLTIDPKWSIESLLRITHQQQQDLLAFQRSELVDIQYRFSAVPGRLRMFDSLVVFQNFGSQAPTPTDPPAVRLTNYRSVVTSNYPVTLSVEPVRGTWRLSLTYDEARITETTASGWLTDLSDTLSSLAGSAPSLPLEAVAGEPSTVPDGEADRPRSAPADSEVSDYAAPSTPLESKLVSIWAKELGLRKVGIRDNFFDIGGHSLVALRIFSEIERELGCRLPLAVLSQASTIEALARIAGEQLAGHAPEIMFIPLSTPGTKAPVILMPGAGGEALFWQHLDDWVEDRPVYTLGLTTSEMPWPSSASLEDIARFYADAIARTVDDRPVHLAGYSFGGLLAFAVARRLEDMSRRVGTVAIVDTALERFSEPPPIDWANVLPQFAMNLQRWMREEARSRDASKWRLRLSRALQHGRAKLGLGEEPENPLEQFYRAEDLTEEHLARIKVEIRTALEYAPPPRAGRLVLFRAKRQPLLRILPWDLGWSQVVRGPVEVIEVPGNHENVVFPPYSQNLARQLQATLDRVESASQR